MSLGKSLSGFATELGVIKELTIKTGIVPEPIKDKIDDFKISGFGRKKRIHSLLLAVTAVGFSIIYNEDKLFDSNKENISTIEEADIIQYIKKLGEKTGNRKLKIEILEMKNNQIDFVEALNYVAKIKPEDWDIFEKILNKISKTSSFYSDETNI